MVHFQSIDVKTFLSEYWQKKPLVIRQALPDFINLLSPDELAGLAMEEGVESRIVFETPGTLPHWSLKRGPFLDTDFAALPKTHWTLLVQSVDLLVPEIAGLLDHFDFIPQWRVDDIMISYAVKQGSVGPHYDNYDVFLYQASGKRKWSLTTKNCNETNSLKGVELRIMEQFEVEDEYTLMPGDMLYLPPHVGHHGVSLSDDCMTYSFGYRSFQGQELWDSFGDYLSEHNKCTSLYRDPNWSTIKATSAIPQQAYLNAKQVMQQMLADATLLQSWFACFITRLDQQAEQHMPLPLEQDEWGDPSDFINELLGCTKLLRDSTCRIAYLDEAENAIGTTQLFINGCRWNTDGVSSALIKKIANNRQMNTSEIAPFLEQEDNQQFLYELWKLQWLEMVD